MKEKINHSQVWIELTQNFGNLYPYFLGFYIFAGIISNFFEAWRSFFYWPAFHGVIIVYTIFFLISILEIRLGSTINSFNINFHKPSSASPTQIVNDFIKPLASLLKELAKRMSRSDWIKTICIGVVMIYSLIVGIAILNFLVLCFGLISVIFIVENRWSAGMAFVALTLCPIFLVAHKDIWAEHSAILAYYFLIISLVTELRKTRRG